MSEKDNPAKNFAITGYLKAFPKDGETKPTKEDFDEALLELTSPEVVEAIGLNTFVGQVEVGANGTMHLQGFAQTVKRTRRATLNKRVRKHSAFNWSIQNAGGSVEQNVQYCTKETGEWTYSNGTKKFSTTLGTPVWIGKDRLTKQGASRTLAEAIRAMENGLSPRELDQRFANVMIRNGKAMLDMKFRKDAEEKKALRAGMVVVLHGPAGTGKSWRARHVITKEMGLTPADVYSCILGGSQPWFDGYNGEKILLIDDWELGAIKPAELKRMTDRYAYHGAIKGSHVVAAWEMVIFTTNEPYEEMFGHVEIENHPDYGRVEHFHPDAAMYSRVDYHLDFTGMPDKRSEIKQRSSARMVDLVQSDAPLLPASLALGTNDVCEESQSGVRGSIPRPVEPPKSGETTSAQNDNFGTISDEEVGASA